MYRLPYALLMIALVLSTPAAAEANRVLVFMVDGLRTDAMEFASTPNIDALIANGTYSPNATVSDLTFSGPGQTDVQSGVHRDLHGATTNGTADNPIEPDPQFQIYSGSSMHLYPDFQAIANTANPALQTARFTGAWNPAHTTRSPAGSEYTFVGSDAAAAADAANYYSSDSNNSEVGFIYLAEPDYAGHANGFHPTRVGYTNEITATDARIGSVISTIQGRTNFVSEDWIFIISSDHGGSINGGHSGNQVWQREAPIIVSGNSVINQTLPYGAKNVDVVPTVLTHLGITLPSYLAGHAVGLSAPPVPSIALDSNLIFHGDAEFDHGFTSRSFDQAITGWNEFPGADFLAETAPYGGNDSATILQNSSVGATGAAGDNLFSGGGNVNATMVQEIDVSSLAATIDAGLFYQMQAQLGGEGSSNDRADFRVRFLDTNSSELGQITLPGPDAAARGNTTSLQLLDLNGTVPVGTRSVEVALLTFGDTGLADNLSFLMSESPPPITGDLDGDDDIDGADWLLFIAGSGTAAPGNTDLNGDGVNDYDDFLIFKQAYNNFNPGSSFDEMAASVPEPASLTLLVVGLALALTRRRR